jgi:hypothetical protein
MLHRKFPIKRWTILMASGTVLSFIFARFRGLGNAAESHPRGTGF